MILSRLDIGHRFRRVALKAPGQTERTKKRPRETAMITTNSRSAGVRFAIAILLSAVIAGGYLSAIGFLNPGFIA